MAHPRQALGRWDRARAAVLSVALLGHLIYALPIPNAVSDRDLNSPESREEVARWMELTRTFDRPMSEDAIRSVAKNTSQWWSSVHRALEAPFRPLMRFTRTGQGWAFFASPPTHPARLEILGRRQGESDWELVFRRLDSEHDLLGSQIAFRRMRGIYDGPRHKVTRRYRNFARWAAREVFQRRPDLDEVRVQLRPLHSTLPSQKAELPGEPVLIRDHRRGTR